MSEWGITRRERLLASVDKLGNDELHVLCIIAERLVMGRRQYGELELPTDRRDFAHEALEEVSDALVYAAAGLLRVRECREQAARAETEPP